jgi:hypothetical protein
MLFITLSFPNIFHETFKYIAYDNRVMVMPKSLGQCLIWQCYDPFVLWLSQKLNIGYNFIIIILSNFQLLILFTGLWLIQNI